MRCRCRSAQMIKRKSSAADLLPHLRELWSDPLSRQTLYECPETGMQWLRESVGLYLNGDPIVYRRLPLTLDFSHYLGRKFDLACRCLAISELSGAAAAEYAQFHLLKTAENINECKIEFHCPVTSQPWVMHFPSTRVRCGGIPVLIKTLRAIGSPSE